MKEREAKSKIIGKDLYIETIECRNCHRIVFPKKIGKKFIFPQRCPEISCRNPYYGDPYTRGDYLNPKSNN